LIFFQLSERLEEMLYFCARIKEEKRKLAGKNIQYIFDKQKDCITFAARKKIII
jgi:hypothetical protein